MTKQEMFDVMVRGLASQGWRRCQTPSGCRYSDGRGNHCAVGWLVPKLSSGLTGGIHSIIRRAETTFFSPEITEKVLSLSPEASFLEEAQIAHDESTTPEQMKAAFVTLGDLYNLTWPEEVAA